MAEVYISKGNWNKIINFAKASYQEFKAEIGGMAVVYKDEEDDWVVTDPIILKQEVTAGTCSIDKTELAKYYTRAGMKWIKKEFRFCWWHSHHTMGAFWSKTDTDSIDEYSDGDISFALVVNLKEEYKFRISIWKPFEMHEDVTLNILGGRTDNVPKKILAEVKDKCEKPAVREYGHTSYGKDWHKQEEIDARQIAIFNEGYDTKGLISTTFKKDNLHDSLNAATNDRCDLVSSFDEFDLYDPEFNKVWDQVSEWMDALTEGTLDFNKYVEFNKSFNAELEKNRSKYRTLEMPNPVGDKLYCAWAEQYIAIKEPGKSDVFVQLDAREMNSYGY